MCVNRSYCSWDGGVYSAGFSEYGWWRREEEEEREQEGITGRGKRREWGRETTDKEMPQCRETQPTSLQWGQRPFSSVLIRCQQNRQIYTHTVSYSIKHTEDIASIALHTHSISTPPEGITISSLGTFNPSKPLSTASCLENISQKEKTLEHQFHTNIVQESLPTVTLHLSSFLSYHTTSNVLVTWWDRT